MPVRHCKLDTQALLHAAADGDPAAAEDLLPLVYDELRALARVRLNRESPGQTLQPTALVHEAYLRVVGCKDARWDDRGHFFAATARAMRQVLVENARRKTAQKRGGDRRRVASEHTEPAIQPCPETVLSVDEALVRLERDDPRKAQIVNLRYFARMTTVETAEALNVSVGTIERDWRYIRAWLHRELAANAESEDG
ncbi:MAG: sigma-70 family RNA polymerase sigma factor [Phycisphaerales bacterium]|nr:MAG: sigma-70 family RNA polymerase sigma factor [Phycisphaerales bacterium]